MTNTDVLQIVVPLIQKYQFDVYHVSTTETDVDIKIDVIHQTDAARFDIIIDKNYLSEDLIINQLETIEQLIWIKKRGDYYGISYCFI